MRGTAPSSHWRISAPHAPTHQFASTNPLTKHTLHTYLNARHEDTWYRHLNSAPILLCHLERPHESIPSPRSSQCRAPPLRAHINPSHRADLVSVVRPHGSPPQINSITPIQLRAPMARPHNSIPSPTSSQCRTPMACSPQINPISPIQSRTPMTRPHKLMPLPRSRGPVPAIVAHPHKSIPSPRSSQCREPPSIKHISPIQPGSRAPMNQSHRPDPASVAWPHGVPPWINPIAPVQPMSPAPMNQSHLPDPASVARPHGATPPINPITRSSHTHPWRIPINQCNRPDPARAVRPNGRWVRSAPDRRSPHFSTIATSHWRLPGPLL